MTAASGVTVQSPFPTYPEVSTMVYGGAQSIYSYQGRNVRTLVQPFNVGGITLHPPTRLLSTAGRGLDGDP